MSSKLPSSVVHTGYEGSNQIFAEKLTEISYSFCLQGWLYSQDGRQKRALFV